MACKKCGTVSPENAVYCPECGYRLDGKKACPTCGEFNEEQFKYCIACGARIDGKTTCPSCGTEHEGKFCPQCGMGATVKKADKKEKKVHNGIYKKVMKIVSVSLGLAAALTAFVFMFFIGFSGEKSIFYYFSEAFKDLKVLNSFNGLYLSGAIKGVSYFAVILSCVIAAITLAGVTTLFVLTIIRTIKSLCGKQTRSPIKVALWTVFFYAVGVAALYHLEGGEIMGERLAMNGATLSGLIVTSALLGATVVCTMLRDLKRFKNKSFIVRCICLASCIAVGSVTFFMLRNAGLKAVLKIERSYISGEGAPANVSAFLLGMFSMLYSDKPQLKFEMNMLSVFGIIGELLVIAAIVLLLLSIFKNVGACAEGKGKAPVLYSILAFGLSVGAFIVSILIWNQAKLIIGTTYVSADVLFYCKYVLSILAMAFSFVNMGIAIAARMVLKKNEETEIE